MMIKMPTKKVEWRYVETHPRYGVTLISTKPFCPNCGKRLK
jgi:hypothetical protein